MRLTCALSKTQENWPVQHCIESCPLRDTDGDACCTARRRARAPPCRADVPISRGDTHWPARCSHGGWPSDVATRGSGAVAPNRRGYFADENPRMTLTLPDGQPFATGATAYHYRPATAQETTPRLVLEVVIDGIVTPADGRHGWPLPRVSPRSGAPAPPGACRGDQYLRLLRLFGARPLCRRPPHRDLLFRSCLSCVVRPPAPQSIPEEAHHAHHHTTDSYSVPHPWRTFRLSSARESQRSWRPCALTTGDRRSIIK